jgi:acyl-CoA dehydrogenase
MLMESLAAGRGISLPSSSTGMAKLAVRATGAYARVRSQFKTPIGKFEGVEEALTRMGGNLYMMDATRMLTALAVDLGEKPAVLSAIAKYHLTERARNVVIDGMDVAGGKGVCMGPSNFLGSAYMQLPVSITVEGANILTRSLIIFGQGAIRCHPFVLREISAANEPDRTRASIAFDSALFGHIGFVLSNMARTFVMGLCGSHCARVPSDVAPETRRYYQQLTRFSAALAFLADISMGVLGGALKRKEKLSARLGDVLSMLYLCSSTLKRYENEGRQADDAPLMHWAIWDAMFRAQNAIEGVISNFPSRMISGLLRTMVFPLGRPYVVPSDKLGHDVARLLIEPSATRDRLTAGMYLPADEGDALGAIELALAAILAAEPVEARMREAFKAGRFSAAPGADRGAAAIAAGVISADELTLLQRASELADRVIRVDDFAQDLGASELKPRAASAPAGTASRKIAAA